MKSLKKVVGLVLFLAIQPICATLPEPYSVIRNLPATPYYVQDGYTYYQLILSNNSAVIVDVESQDEGVARFIAQQATNLPLVTQIYSVNGWQDIAPQKQQFQRFLSNVIQENTTNMIIPIRMNSQDAAAAFNFSADFISLVGANDGNTIYNDILVWYPHLSNIGVMCGNNWYDNSVETGVTKAAKALDLTLHVNNNVWYFIKNS